MGIYPDLPNREIRATFSLQMKTPFNIAASSKRVRVTNLPSPPVNALAINTMYQYKSACQPFGYISSTLVDKNALNPDQIIFWFSQENESYLHCKPTQLQSYKIQRTELQSSEFKIHISEKENLTKIENIFLQLKITDAGIQQRSEFAIQ